jgi:hypothetical protein
VSVLDLATGHVLASFSVSVDVRVASASLWYDTTLDTMTLSFHALDSYDYEVIAVLATLDDKNVAHSITTTDVQQCCARPRGLVLGWQWNPSLWVAHDTQQKVALRPVAVLGATPKGIPINRIGRAVCNYRRSAHLCLGQWCMEVEIRDYLKGAFAPL